MHLVLLHRATLKLMRNLTNDIGIRQLVLANKQNLILAQVEKNPLTEHEHESYSLLSFVHFASSTAYYL